MLATSSSSGSSSSSSSYTSDSKSSSYSEGCSWIEWYSSINEFFVQIDEEYVSDSFNLCGLSNKIPHYDEALNLILDCLEEGEDESLIEPYAIQLYGLIQARFLLTSKGQSLWKEKLQQCVYGLCPNFRCEKQAMLPIGSDWLSQGPTRVYCPCCCEVYFPRSSKLEALDGAYFGSTAATMFFMVAPELVKKRSS
jgi:casein kinase II subunit beta